MAYKTKLISLRLTQAFHAELSRAAKQDQRTLGDWIRLRLTEVLQLNKSKQQAAD